MESITQRSSSAAYRTRSGVREMCGAVPSFDVTAQGKSNATQQRCSGAQHSHAPITEGAACYTTCLPPQRESIARFTEGVVPHMKGVALYKDAVTPYIKPVRHYFFVGSRSVLNHHRISVAG